MVLKPVNPLCPMLKTLYTLSIEEKVEVILIQVALSLSHYVVTVFVVIGKKTTQLPYTAKQIRPIKIKVGQSLRKEGEALPKIGVTTKTKVVVSNDTDRGAVWRNRLVLVMKAPKGTSRSRLTTQGLLLISHIGPANVFG